MSTDAIVLFRLIAILGMILFGILIFGHYSKYAVDYIVTRFSAMEIAVVLFLVSGVIFYFFHNALIRRERLEKQRGDEFRERVKLPPPFPKHSHVKADLKNKDFPWVTK